MERTELVSARNELVALQDLQKLLVSALSQEKAMLLALKAKVIDLATTLNESDLTDIPINDAATTPCSETSTANANLSTATLTVDNAVTHH
ncbi:MAG: hypothetical protein LBS86_03990 [Treponema sp.]|jgi:hypothetical protein|nr:hypothetical protein [Treponema sp.]